jgi:uncharacterized short protein YbdD (DUF466 family)
MNDTHKIAGNIDYLGEQHSCTVNDYVVKIFYKDAPGMIGLVKDEPTEEKYLYGIGDNDSPFAVYMPKGLYVNPFSFHVLYHFSTPIIITSRSSETSDLSYFDGIEFYGETINKIFNPRQAVEYSEYSQQIEDISLKFKSHSDYSRKFDVDFDGQKAAIEYLVYRYVSLAEQKNEDGSISLGSLNSAIRFTFDGQRPLEEINRYWKMFNNFLQFMVGRQNVDFGVRFFQKNKADSLLHTADGFFRRGKPDTYNGKIQNSIQINTLGDKFPELFRLFLDEQTAPYLNFLPESNTAANRISYTDVLDICTAFEKEFVLSGLKNPINDIADKLYNTLKAAIKEFRKTQVQTEQQQDKIFDVAFSSIKYINSSLADKIYLLYELSLTSPDEVSEEALLKTRNDIDSFVQLRNSIMHSGIVDWGENGLFSRTLIRILYVNILLRAGVDKKTATNIAESKWRA